MYGDVVPGRGQTEEREPGYFPCTYVLPRSIPRIALGDLEQENFLGDGGFGQVFKHSYKGRPVAVKEIKTRELARRTMDNFETVHLISNVEFVLICIEIPDF